MGNQNPTLRVIDIHEAVQGKNSKVAERLRKRFQDAGVFVINVMSAPGSGKTEFIKRTLAEFPDRRPYHRADGPRMAVIVGDIATDNDARRLSQTGAEAVQITTNGYCHLDASMIERALDEIDLSRLDILVIENVGNMVCPATFDLGEAARICLLSVTEGEDKPLKYPTLFKVADAIIVNKVDLADAVDFHRASALSNMRSVAPQAPIFEVSARTGQGMPVWYEYLQDRMIASRR